MSRPILTPEQRIRQRYAWFEEATHGAGQSRRPPPGRGRPEAGPDASRPGWSRVCRNTGRCSIDDVPGQFSPRAVSLQDPLEAQ